MFNIKKVKSLQEELEALTAKNANLKDINFDLQRERDMLKEDNQKLHDTITDLKAEYAGQLVAKEIERQELCDQLANANEQLEATKKELEQARCTIDKLQAKVARKGCPRDEKGHFIKKEK